jgi:hypothetical protein
MKRSPLKIGAQARPTRAAEAIHVCRFPATALKQVCVHICHEAEKCQIVSKQWKGMYMTSIDGGKTCRYYSTYEI